jgi:tetratricopeptide (TPR) repeat protein
MWVIAFMSHVLQRKFEDLLRETCSFFEELDVNGPRDLAMLQSLRTLALELAAERAHPDFPAFIAYLLSVTDISTHYPLQPIRYLALVAYACHVGGVSQDTPMDELFLAAFLADLGFRASWLGHQGDHRQVVTYRLEALKQPWVTPRIHHWILEHHDAAKDSSPKKVLSFMSRFLELAHGLGNDLAKPQIFPPALALEKVVKDYTAYPDSIKTALKTLSSFPLGTWVRLSSGEAVLVVCPNPDKPLRPVVGYWHADTWKLRDLSQELAVHIAREEAPSLAQRAFSNTPSYWISGWKETKALQAQVLADAFNVVINSVENAGPKKQDDIIPGGERAQDPHVLLGDVPPPAPAPILDAPSAEELGRFRDDWAIYVRQVEEAVDRLKMGVVESYKRENERYKSILKNSGLSSAAPEPRAAVDFTALAAPMERRLSSAQEYLSTARTALQEKRHAFQEMLHHTAKALQFFATQSPTISVSSIEARITAAEAELLGNAWTEPPAFQELDMAIGTGKQFIESLKKGLEDPLVWERATSPRVDSAWEQARAEASRQLQWQTQKIQEQRHLAEAFTKLFKAIQATTLMDHILRGITARQKGQWAEAEAYFMKAITLHPEAWEAYACLGLCYLGQKDKRAIQAFEKSSTLNPQEISLRQCLDLSKKILAA